MSGNPLGYSDPKGLYQLPSWNPLASDPAVQVANNGANTGAGAINELTFGLVSGEYDPNIDPCSAYYQAGGYLTYAGGLAGVIKVVGRGVIGGIRSILGKSGGPKPIPSAGSLKNPSGNLGTAANAARNQGNLSFQFGNNANQIHHTFRHTNKAGLSRSSVQSAISRDLNQNGALLRAGSNTRTVSVGGTNLQFNAHRLPNGTVNVGRITPQR